MVYSFQCTHVIALHDGACRFPMKVPRKRRKISLSIPQQSAPFLWDSPFKKEAQVTVSTTELGDSATSRVFLDYQK